MDKTGTFLFTAKYKGDLVAIFNYAERSVEWMTNLFGIRKKMVMPLSTIDGLGLHIPADGYFILTIELQRPPTFLLWQQTPSEAWVPTRYLLPLSFWLSLSLSLSLSLAL